jgi:hypothetical protein
MGYFAHHMPNFFWSSLLYANDTIRIDSNTVFHEHDLHMKILYSKDQTEAAKKIHHGRDTSKMKCYILCDPDGIAERALEKTSN